jgi:eukaryotic-like serine/threonine-protein kinase
LFSLQQALKMYDAVQERIAEYERETLRKLGEMEREECRALAPDEKPFPLVESTYSTTAPRFSPDGRWLAYTSDESGRGEVYVRRFPRSERNWIVSTGGGTLPVWARDGREIFYLEGRRMMAVSVQAGAAFSAGRPVLLFDRPELTMAYPAFDVMGDGFLMVERDPLSMLTEFRVVQNWLSQWKQ